jgi:gliding motility-associated-like protein
MKSYTYLGVVVLVFFFGWPVLCAGHTTNLTKTFTGFILNEPPTAAGYSPRAKASVPTANVPPTITATGNSIYCPGMPANIVSDVTITDPDDSSTEMITIQITSGYVSGQDLLTLTGSHPTIACSWDATSGKLKLYSPDGIPVLYTEFIAALKDIQFSNSSVSPSGNRSFIISIGSADYLALSGHYYQFVSNPEISWTAAKTAAEVRSYFGMEGYLCTITTLEEAKFVGLQATEARWIGGSDAETEGVWKWVTGPEKGMIFWNGKAKGSTPNFAFWKVNQPDDAGSNEDYVHITVLGSGVRGSWNDQPNAYNPLISPHPQGYVVEFGGMPGDLLSGLSVSISLISNGPASIISTTSASGCGNGCLMLEATASSGIVHWYADASGGSSLATGNSFTTPVLDTSTTYYVQAECAATRIPIAATVNSVPEITSTNSPISRCGAGTVTLEATTTMGTVHWYATADGGTIEASGSSMTLSNVTTSTTYYAEAVNNGCSNGIRVAVAVVLYPYPVVPDEEQVLCPNGRLELDAGLAGLSYLWSTGETTQKITVSHPDTFMVALSSPAPESCSYTRSVIVTTPPNPEITNIVVDESNVVIQLHNSDAYFEYSLDGIQYQSSNRFVDVPAGLQTAYVRGPDSCGSVSRDFVVLEIPQFFTPNNDSYNDLWEVKGLADYPDAELTVFDRYGKLITQLNASQLCWDGTFHSVPLPASDYWYVLKIEKTKPEIRGHFSLKR